jgi:hypothetical protein
MLGDEARHRSAIPLPKPVEARAFNARLVPHRAQRRGEGGIVGQAEVAAHGLIGEQPVYERLDAVLAEAGEVGVVDAGGGLSGVGDSDQIGEDVELGRLEVICSSSSAIPSARRQSRRATSLRAKLSRLMSMVWPSSRCCRKWPARLTIVIV